MPDYTDLARRLRESHPLDLSQEDRNRAAEALEAMREPTEAQIEGLAHEVWAAAQLIPGEGIVDGIDRIVKVLRAALAARENNDAE